MCQTLERSLPHIGQLGKLMIRCLAIWQKVKRHNCANMRIVERATKKIWEWLKVLPHKEWKFDQVAGAHKFVHILRRKIFLGRGECKRSWIENCSFHTRLHHSTIIWLEMNSQTLQKEWPIECTLYSSQCNIVLQIYRSCRRHKTKVFRTTRKHIDYELHILPVSTFILLLC